VVQNFALSSVRGGLPNGIFTAWSQMNLGRSGTVDLVVRAADASGLIGDVRRLISETFPDALGVHVFTGRDLVARNLGSERLGAWLFSGFGGVGLLLGIVGVFGLVASLVQSRRREMGIRLALGAVPADVMRLVLATGLGPVLVGVIAGLGASLLAGRVLASSLVDADPADWQTVAAVLSVVLVAGVAAGIVAAARLRHVSPAEVLRAE
jgi:putative ABC transport system permease protein